MHGRKKPSDFKQRASIWEIERERGKNRNHKKVRRETHTMHSHAFREKRS